MQGSYNSEAQANADSTYFNISLHMYPIWDSVPGNFLYVEQALNSKQDQPYRQRIYQLRRQDDSTFTSYIYKFPNDSLYVFGWKRPELFDSLSLNDLDLLEGCEVSLKHLGDSHYKGATGYRTCSSVLYGASYATSEVEILSDKVISWDRGFDSTGAHIWGAEFAGYVFDKLPEAHSH